MTNALATMTNATSPRAALVVALKEVNLYTGCSVAGPDGALVPVCRATLPVLRAYAADMAASLQAPEAVVETVVVEPEPVVAEPVVEAAPAPEAPKDDAPRCPMTGRRLSDAQLRNDAQLVEVMAAGVATEQGILVDASTWVAVMGDNSMSHNVYGATAWRTGDATSQPSVWNPYFMAAVRAGVAGGWEGDKRGTGTLLLVQLDEAGAQAQREALALGEQVYQAARDVRRTTRPAVAPSVLAARTKAVNAGTVGKLQVLLAAADKGTDGTVSLTAEALALGGVSVSWARTSNKHLADEAHVAARTFAALGYTARTNADVLTCTPLAAQAAAVVAA